MEEDEVITDEEGTPVDPEDEGDSPPVDEEEVPPVEDDGDRPDVDWSETGVEGDAHPQQTFTSQPTTPYYEGDIWQDGTTTYLCLNTRLTGSYDSTDWTPAVNPEPTPTVITRTVTYDEVITDYSAASLAAYEAAGAVAYAIYDDGTEQQFAWADVYDPSSPAVAAVSEAWAVASATNQYFWHRSTDPSSDGAGTGAFVTDDTQENFLAAAAQDFPDRSATKPYMNQLINSQGTLLRSGKINLAQFTPSGTAYYDGLGNGPENIVAQYWKNGAQVGADGSPHMRLTSTGLYGENEERLRLFNLSMDGSSTTTQVKQRVWTSYVGGTSGISGLWRQVASVLGGANSSVTLSTSGRWFVLVQRVSDFTSLTPDTLTVEGTGRYFGYATPVFSAFDPSTDWTWTAKLQAAVVGSDDVLVLRWLFEYAADTKTLTCSLYCDEAYSGGTVYVGDMWTYANFTSTLYAPAFTLGTRSTGQPNFTSGAFSFASGEGLVAPKRDQVVFGSFNALDTTSAILLGNGTGEDNRSNALWVGTAGDVHSMGSFTNYNAATDSAAAYESHYADIDSTETRDATVYKRLLVSRDANEVEGTVLQTSYLANGATVTGLLSNGAAGWRGFYMYNFLDGTSAIDALSDSILLGNTDVDTGSFVQYRFRTKNYSGSFIRAYDNGTSYGHNLLIQSGGLLILGSGEYAANRYALSDLQGQDIEATYLGSDNQVYIETAGNSIANRKTFTFGNNGDLWMPPDGRVYVDSATIDIDATSQTSRVTTSGLVIRDVNDNIIGNTYAEQLANGSTGLRLSARRGSVYNAVSLRVTNNGAREVYVDAPAEWREALGYATSSTAPTITSATNFTISGITARKQWGMVQILFQVKTTNALTANTNYTVGTISTTAYRPVMEADLVPRAAGAAASTLFRGYIQAGGNIVIRPNQAVAAGATLYAWTIYLAASF